MRIARFMLSGRPTIAVDRGEGWVDFGAILESHGFRSEIADRDPDSRIIRMLRRGMFDRSFVEGELDWAARSGISLPLDVEGLTPLLPLKPGKIVCMARNWAEHAREGGHDTPEKPIYFVKTENCAIGPGEPVPLPEGIGRVDYEGELGVVISGSTAMVSAADVEKYILGYTILNDITARELQHELAGKGLPWYMAKSMDGFAPVGPWVVLRDDMEPLEGKRIRVTVNGELKQDGVLDDMIWHVPQIIEAISRHITLFPGDIIATGTPAGVGEIHPGDEVVVEIDGIGRLTNPVGTV